MNLIRVVDRIFFSRVNDRIFRERIRLAYKFDLALAEYVRRISMDHNEEEDEMVGDFFDYLRQTYEPEGSCPDMEMYNLASEKLQREYDQIPWRICNITHT